MFLYVLGHRNYEPLFHSVCGTINIKVTNDEAVSTISAQKLIGRFKKTFISFKAASLFSIFSQHQNNCTPTSKI